MKKIILSILLITSSLFSSKLIIKNSFVDANMGSIKTNKPLLVIITTEECKWCKKMKTTTLRNKEVINKLNNDFSFTILVKNDDNYPRKLHSRLVPFSYFLLNGKIIYKVPGYWNSEDYLSILNDGLKKAKKINK